MNRRPVGSSVVSPEAPPVPRPIRVAHVIGGLYYGGMERVLHDLTRQLPARGFDVHIVVLEGFGRFADGLGECATLHQAPRMSKLSLFHPGELIALLRNIAPDIVHSHSGVWFKAARAARLAGVPVMIHTEHGRGVPDPLSARLLDNRASRWTNAVIAVSEAVADLLRRRVVHDPSRVHVITNGVDAGRFRRPGGDASLRQELGIPDESIVIGSVGRLEPVKNYRLALRAFARLAEQVTGTCAPFLVIIGDGSERAELEDLSRQLGIAARVRFLGWRDDVERLYGAFDLFTLTSRSEGTSISLLEAMSAGLCPVVTDVGGNRAVLGEELASLLVPDDDEVSLARAWRLHLADRALRLEMGRGALLRVTQAFSLQRMVEQYATIYPWLLAGGTIRKEQ